MQIETLQAHWTSRLRSASASFALKLVSGLLDAACARTWMPGTCPGVTSGSLLSEKRREHD